VKKKVDEKLYQRLQAFPTYSKKAVTYIIYTTCITKICVSTEQQSNTIYRATEQQIF